MEAFLKEVETTLIKQVNLLYDEKDKMKVNKTSKESQIKDLTKLLSKSTKVVVPTDKTNSFVIIETAEYTKWVLLHLNKAATTSSTDRIKEIFDSANALPTKMEDRFDENEYNFIKETVDSRAIPTPKLLVKDHKNPMTKETILQDW